MKRNYRYFKSSELACKHCGKHNPNSEFDRLMKAVDKLREAYGRPLRVTSAYRCEDHPIEARKARGGQHTIAAIDLAVSGKDAVELLRLALAMRDENGEPTFRGIGIQQKGGGRFLHLDVRKSPTIWSY